MKATIESTTKIVTLKINGVGVPARIWEGHTESGTPCHFFVTRVAVSNDQPSAEFVAELQEHRAPSLEIDRTYVADARLIL